MLHTWSTNQCRRRGQKIKISSKDNKLIFDYSGTIIFTKNEAGIIVDRSVYEDKLNEFSILNAIVFMAGKGSIYSRIKSCIALWNFMKRG